MFFNVCQVRGEPIVFHRAQAGEALGWSER